MERDQRTFDSVNLQWDWHQEVADQQQENRKWPHIESQPTGEDAGHMLEDYVAQERGSFIPVAHDCVQLCLPSSQLKVTSLSGGSLPAALCISLSVSYGIRHLIDGIRQIVGRFRVLTLTFMFWRFCRGHCSICSRWAAASLDLNHNKLFHEMVVKNITPW